MATVGELEALLAHHAQHDDEVTFNWQVKHSSNDPGVYVRVALCVNGIELLNVEADNRMANVQL